ncbi:MAG: AAA family ATPase [Sphingomonas sp.]|nr:AAA family ATPase [Sphingomonas sp.]
MELVVNNSPEEAEARAWLLGHRQETGLSWSELQKLTDIDGSTLSRFAGGKYTGDNAKVAAKVLAYRERLRAQAELAADAPVVPAFYETATTRQLTGLFRLAQSGKIILIASAPGVGKTKAAERFAQADPNVWLATMAPSTAGVATMCLEVAAAIGLGDLKGTPQQLSSQIRAHVRGKNGLLIVDEAQELNEKAINEIRSWHDRTGVGIVLLGNEKVVGQIDARKSALVQISSRIFQRCILREPKADDLEALFDAWKVDDRGQREFLVKIGRGPGALREVTHTLEAALIAAQGAPLTLDLLRGAAKQRNVRIGGL